MTSELTDTDHDAVDWLYEMGVIAPHHLRLANEAFARHRGTVRAEMREIVSGPIGDLLDVISRSGDPAGILDTREAGMVYKLLEDLK